MTIAFWIIAIAVSAVGFLIVPPNGTRSDARMCAALMCVAISGSILGFLAGVPAVILIKSAYLADLPTHVQGGFF